MARTHPALSPHAIRPEVLDVSPAPLSYASAPPIPASTITILDAPPPVAPAPPTAHIVAPGETLFAIARHRLGDESRWRDIVAANPGLVASEIKAGQTLKLPQ